MLLPARMMMIMVVVGKNLSLPSTSYGPISGRKDISHAHNNFLEIGLSSPFLNRTFLLQVQREESFLLPLTRRSKLPQITTLKQHMQQIIKFNKYLPHLNSNNIKSKETRKAAI